MEEDYDDDDLFYEDDYLYVEDSYALADELAENQLPLPHLDLGDDDLNDEHDYYDYWLDIEYGTDEYYDVPIAVNQTAGDGKSFKKRKAHDAAVHEQNSKRRKTDDVRAKAQVDRSSATFTWGGPLVIWLPSHETYKPVKYGRAFEGSETYSLLPGWRSLLDNSSDVGKGETKHAAVLHQPPPSRNRRKGVPRRGPARARADQPDVEPEEPEASQILAALQSKLTEAGMSGEIAQKFQQVLMDMGRDGEELDLDNVLEELTGSVLAQIEEGGAETDMGRWLTGQGVDLNVAEGACDADSEQLEEPNDLGGVDVNGEPEDQASLPLISSSVARQDSGSGQELLGVDNSDGSTAQPSMRGKKRKAADEDVDHAHPAKASKGRAAATKSNRPKKAAQPSTRNTRTTRSQK